MSLFLKQNLPNQFNKDVHQKGAYCIENGSICCSVSLKKIKQYNPTDINDLGQFKYVFDLLISVLDKYSELYEQGIYKIVISASLENKVIEPLNNSFDARNWDITDEDGLKNALNNYIIPWLNKYSDSNLLIEYLIALENVANGLQTRSEVSKFGELIIGDLIFPKRLMKAHNGIIATLYENLGNQSCTLKHLKQHREFVINDHSPLCKDKSMNEVYKKRLNTQIPI